MWMTLWKCEGSVCRGDRPDVVYVAAPADDWKSVKLLACKIRKDVGEKWDKWEVHRITNLGPVLVTTTDD